MKFLILVIALVNSQFTLARNWHSDIKDSHLELEIGDQSLVQYKTGDMPEIKGHFCVKKEKKSKCMLLTPETLSKHDVKFFYPDITNEVTENVQLVVKNDRHEFTYLAEEIQSNSNAQFIAQIFNKGSRVTFYQKSLLKVQTLIEKLLGKISQSTPRSRKHLEKFLTILRGIEARWLTLLQNETSVIAKRNYPIQINNNISRPSSWINALEEWQVSVDATLGNTFEGEKTWIDIALTPYPSNDDQWRIEYYLDNKHLKTKDLTSTPALIVTERILSSALDSGIHDLRIKISRKKKFLWISTWDEVFEKEYSVATFNDDTDPVLTGFNEEYISKTGSLTSVLNIIDEKGRVDLSSSRTALTLSSGEVKILNPEFVLQDQVLVPSIHGNQTGATKVKLNLAIDSLPEGRHQVSTKISDFTGNESSANSEILIDKTPPFIQLSSLPGITNLKDQTIGLTVVDSNETLTSIFNNGLQVHSDSAKSFDYEISLNEGINLIKIVSEDEAGNISEINLNPVILDTIAPSISQINLVDGDIIKNLNFNLQGSANEKLEKFYINGNLAALGENKLTFQGSITHQVEGEQNLTIKAVDLAGNSFEKNYKYQFVLRILDKNLISVVPSETSSGLIILGLPGAAKPGIEIEASAGFFNTGETTANSDGSFEIELDYFTTVEVEAFDPDLERTESFNINFNVDTTFAGIVKDVYDNPLPGVKVTIVGTGQVSTTDAKGIFAIPNPVLGDQQVIIDGTSIPIAITNNEKAYGSLAINVSLGNREQNVLERPIYLAPKLLDGTETQITQNAEAVVESPHAPGLRIDIPAGVVKFPGGTKSGSINALEIPSSRSSIEILEEAEPETVYALEPSGLTFSERVHLTLPNVNEFPVGTELVILSKNSETGLWEVDGSANVTGPDKIETKPGEGISHFSEIYAAPIGMEIKSLGDSNKPVIDAFSGTVSNKIELPSFKALGQNIVPTLVYNSQWALPTAVITNVFDLPRKYVKMSASVGSGNIFGSVKAKGTIQTWINPEYIDSQFSTGDFVSEKVRFKGMPDKSVVSYQTDLSHLPTGLYPAESSYEIRFKKITFRTLKITKKRLFKARKTITKKWREETLLDAIFPPSLMTNIYHQNKTQSEFGTGWKIGLGKKILNPNQDRILIEKESGDLALYTLKNSIDTLVYDPLGISSFTSKDNSISYSSKNTIKDFNINSPTSINERNINEYLAYVGFNMSVVTSFHRHGEFNNYPKTYLCSSGKYEVKIDRNIRKILPSSFGVLLLDQNGRLSNLIGNTEQVLVGKNKTFTHLVDNDSTFQQPDYPSPSEFCKNQTGIDCTTVVDYKDYITEQTEFGPSFFSGDPRYKQTCDMNQAPIFKICQRGPCNYRIVTSSGSLPMQGFSDGSGGLSGLALLNNPSSMVSFGNSIYIADTGNNIIRRYNFENNFVSTIAGNRSTLDNGDNFPALQASIYHPRGITISSDGTIYISTERGFIRRIGSDGKIKTIAGKSTDQGGILADITDMLDANLSSPSGLVLDEENNYLYVADTGHNRILRMDLNNSESRVVAGNNTCIPGDTADGKTALTVSLCRPEQIQLDKNNNLLVLDSTNNRIRKINFGNASSSSAQNFQASVEDNSILIREADGSFKLTQRDGKITLFSLTGLELQTKDSVGRISSYEYDASDRLIKANLPTGQSIRLTYSGDLLESITDPGNRVTSFNYSDGRLTEVTYPDSSTRQFNYNERGILTEEFTQKGVKTSYKLDKWNRLQEVELPGGSKLKVQNALSQSIANDSTSDDPKTLSSFGNSPDSLQDIIEDASEIKTIYVRDENGYIDEIISNEGKVTKIERDGKGRTTKVTYPDLSFISLTYDETTGDLLSRFNSKLNASEVFTYNTAGRVISFKGYDGKTTSAEFAPTGLVAKEVLNDGTFATKTYTGLGLVKTLTDHAGRISSFDYDTSGNIVGITSPTGEKTTYLRDLAGNIISKTTPKNETTFYSRDSMNRLASVKTARNNITSYSYSLAGELLSITDPNNNVSTFVYDDFGNMVKTVSPMGEIHEFAYDDEGNLKQEKDPSGNVKSYQYDDKRRISSIQLPDDIINYIYDDEGNVASISNNSSQIQLNYINHQTGTLISSISSSGVYENTFTTTNIYDDHGNRTGLETGLGNFTYSYDDKERLRQITNSNSANVNFDYDNLHRLTNVRRGNIESAYSWNNDDILKSLVHSKDETVVQKFIYQHDKNSNKTDITTLQGSSSFQYDSEGQLVAADQPEINESFDYDNVYNRSQDQNGSFSYNSKKIRLEEDYRYIYAYDSRGNLISRQDKDFSGKVWTYAYNSLNQLINVKLYETTSLLKDVTFKYDVLGRRVKKQVEDFINPQNNKIEKYLYDGESIIAIMNEDEEVLARFIHSGLFSDDVLAVDVTTEGVLKGVAQQTGTFYYIKDAQGTVTDIVNPAGNIVQRYSYSSFGKLLRVTDSAGIEISSPILNTSYTFTGRELDREIDLYYYRARYYDPHSGRFLQKDPVSGFGSSPATLNPYIYSLNNPGNRVDPSGKLSLSGLAQTAIYGTLFGPLGQIYDVNTSDNYSDREVAFINTAIIMAAAAFSGGAAATAAGATSGAAGATVGALAGGTVGGIGFETMGLGNFQQGFIAGAISGAMSGYKVGVKNALTARGNPRTIAANTTTVGLCAFLVVALGYAIVTSEFFKPLVDDWLMKAKQPFDGSSSNQTPFNTQPQQGPYTPMNQQQPNSCQEQAIA